MNESIKITCPKCNFEILGNWPEHAQAIMDQHIKSHGKRTKKKHK